MAEFPRGEKSDPEKAIISSEGERTATSTNDVSQIHSGIESYILLTTYGPAKINQNESKEVGNQGEFMNFKIKFQHNYSASSNTNN